MYVNIEVVVKGVICPFYPKGFYYKGNHPKIKVVLIGCQNENHYKKQTFDFDDCDITLTKRNKFGDVYQI